MLRRPVRQDRVHIAISGPRQMTSARKPMSRFGICSRVNKPGDVGSINIVNLGVAARLPVQPQICRMDRSVVHAPEQFCPNIFEPI